MSQDIDWDRTFHDDISKYLFDTITSKIDQNLCSNTLIKDAGWFGPRVFNLINEVQRRLNE
jgi:hypothetical protein